MNYLRFISLGLFLLVLAVLSLMIGSIETNLSTVIQSISSFDSQDSSHVAIVQLRIPRTLLALFVGGSLAVAGYLMQIMVNNPLGDPYLLGTSSGAALGANIVYLGFLPFSIAGLYTPTLMGSVGAMGITLLAIVISRKTGLNNPSHLILVGITLSSLATAMLSIIIFISGSEGKVRSIIFWMLGSFEKASYRDVVPGALVMAVMLVVLTLLFQRINLLLLGKERSESIGLETVKYRLVVISSICLLTSISVTLAGPIGFVGLVVPHLIRAIFGTVNRLNLIYAAFAGGAFTLLADILSRLLLPPAGMPVGIITSFLGIPFFVYLLFKKKSGFS